MLSILAPQSCTFLGGPVIGACRSKDRTFDAVSQRHAGLDSPSGDGITAAGIVPQRRPFSARRRMISSGLSLRRQAWAWLGGQTGRQQALQGARWMRTLWPCPRAWLRALLVGPKKAYTGIPEADSTCMGRWSRRTRAPRARGSRTRRSNRYPLVPHLLCFSLTTRTARSGLTPRPEGLASPPLCHPAQQESCFTSFVKVCAQSLRPSTMVRYGKS